MKINEITDTKGKDKNFSKLKFSDVQIIKAKLSGHLSFFDNVERKYNGILKYNFRENENPILFIKKCNQQLKNYLDFLDHNLKVKTINLKFYDLARSEIFSLYVFSVSSGLYHFNKSKVKGYINDSIFSIKYSSNDLAINSLYYANAGYLSLIYYFNAFNPVIPFYKMGEKYFSNALQLYSGIALERILSWIIEDCVSDSPNYDSLFIKYKSLCTNQTLLNKTTQIVRVKQKKLHELDQFQKVFSELIVENNNGKFQDLRYLLGFKKDIIIDFWATWCKPCIIQSKFLEKIENQLKDKFIFVFLSTDTNRTLWLNYTKRKFDFQRNRFSFLLSDGFNNKLLKVLDLKSIPRYILIDGKTGKLKNANLPLPEYTSAFIEAIHK